MFGSTVSNLFKGLVNDFESAEGIGSTVSISSTVCLKMKETIENQGKFSIFFRRYRAENKLGKQKTRETKFSPLKPGKIFPSSLVFVDMIYPDTNTFLPAAVHGLPGVLHQSRAHFQGDFPWSLIVI